jgi:hypothetical protein
MSRYDDPGREPPWQKVRQIPREPLADRHRRFGEFGLRFAKRNDAAYLLLMAFLIPVFIIVAVLLAAPQIGIGFLIVGAGTALSLFASKLLLGRTASL